MPLVDGSTHIFQNVSSQSWPNLTQVASRKCSDRCSRMYIQYVGKLRKGKGGNLQLGLSEELDSGIRLKALLAAQSESHHG